MNQGQKDYTILPFPRIREQIIDGLQLASKKHMAHTLLEVEISVARQGLRHLRDKVEATPSLTAFIIYCLGRAVDSHKYMHAYRNRRNQLVLFNDVDICTIIEIDVNGEKFPLDYIIRKANKKSLVEIHNEMINTQTAPNDSGKLDSIHWFLYFPRFIRKIIYKIVGGNPHLIKRNQGTVAVTSVGKFMHGGFWGLGSPDSTLNVVIGGVKECPAIVDGCLETRKHLCLTISFDHEIVDGGPALRFIKRLKKMIESGYGLGEENTS